MRIQFVPGLRPPDLLELPWSTPLAEWRHARLVRMARGPSRHVVRFVGNGERVYALKEMSQPDAEHEYATLRLLSIEGMPAVQASGLVTGRTTATGGALDAVLVTRYLDFALPFHYLFRVEAGAPLSGRLLDAAAVLLARLHLAGFWWGDCSLANLLFRRDAGALMAYLVDAETAEHHPSLSDARRQADVDIARENLAGGLFDLQAGGHLEVDVDVVGYVDLLVDRYTALWDELTGTHEVEASQRHLIDRRIRRLNDLGFDVAELVVEHDVDRLRVTPAVVEEGHHSRELRRLTGLEVQENQARRLLNDIASFGAHLSAEQGRSVPPVVAAARWMTEVYEPAIAAVPVELRDRLEPPELFHELLEHRYFLSEAAGERVDTATALASYVDSVLSGRTAERVILDHEGSPTWRRRSDATTPGDRKDRAPGEP